MRVVWVVVWGACSAAVAADPGRGPRVYLSDSVARSAVELAILGAEHRLRRPDCRLVFTDFADESVVTALEATGLQPAEYLVERIWFVDGSDSPQCVKAGETALFTEAGSKVVRVCADRFVKLAHRRRAAEILIIHEALHTLGLGENPPSSADITSRVTRRCGGS